MPIIPAIHHITAIASDPQRNLNFYAGVLGLRFVKRTVNFDDPGTYHFYFGDERGRPGTILTFFPWPGAARGRQGAGFQSATAFLVPTGSLNAWRERLARLKVTLGGISARFGEQVLSFEDHDGLPLELVESAEAAGMPAWPQGLPASMAIRGFHSATLRVDRAAPTADLLVRIMGLRAADEEAGRQRFVSSAPDSPGRIVDVVQNPNAPHGRLGAGMVHHVAFRAANDAEQREWQAVLSRERIGVTEVKDRNYFRSIYFREPGGILFEIATDAPGFAIDEAPEALGQALRLPSEYESARARIEPRLLPINVPKVAP